MNIRPLAATAVALLAISASAVGAQAKKHHVNPLRKIGSAIQYTARKDAQNLSIDTHKAEGKNSVEKRHHGRHSRKVVVHPGPKKHLFP